MNTPSDPDVPPVEHRRVLDAVPVGRPADAGSVAVAKDVDVEELAPQEFDPPKC